MENKNQPEEIPTYIALSILTALFCCIPFGIIPIFYASKTESLLAIGDRNGALGASAKAKKWAIAAIVTSVLFLISIIIILAISFIFIARNVTELATA